jgi:D-alanyl-D-alanine carboxypeptidase
MDGLKTGFTDASGFNLASTAVRDGHRLFGVVLGSRTAAMRDQLMAQLLDDGFDHRQTPAVLVAGAAGVKQSAAMRVLSALSPIATAEADTLPVTRSTPKRQRRHSKSVPVAVARRVGACPRPGAHAGSCPHRSRATKLAYRSGSKKPPRLAPA